MAIKFSSKKKYYFYKNHIINKKKTSYLEFDYMKLQYVYDGNKILLVKKILLITIIRNMSFFFNKNFK